MRHDRNDRQDRYQGQQQDRPGRQQNRGSQQSPQQWGGGRRSSSINEDRYQSQDWNRNEGDHMDYPTSRSDHYDQWAQQPRQQYSSASQPDYGYGSTQESRDFRNMSEDRYQGAMDFGSHSFNPQRTYNNNPSSNMDRGQDATYGSYSGSGSYGAGSSESPRREQGRFSGRGPKGYKRSDERIKEDISEMITRHDEIDGSDIEIAVASGEVTLTGSVPDRQMKHRVESLIDSSMGVSEINNQLRVKKVDSGGSSSKKSATTSTTNPNH